MPNVGMPLNLWWSNDGGTLRLEQNTVHGFNTVYLTPEQQKSLLRVLQAKGVVWPSLYKEIE